MRPLEWEKEFHNVTVQLAADEYEIVDVRKYLMGMGMWGEYMKVLGLVSASKSKPSWFKLDTTAMNRSYTGKGTPDQLGYTLECAVLAGRAKRDPKSLQDYADAYLGVDCTGFTSGYLVSAGKLASPIWHQPAILGNPGRYPRRTALADIAAGDLMIWATIDKLNNALEVTSGGVGHAVLIDHAFIRVPGKQIWVESAESNGAQGPVASAYSIETAAPAGQWTAYRDGKPPKNSVVIVKI